MSGGTLNLSLLSRGVGEVHTNGHEKIDVYFEPEDYLNFSTPSEGMHLPTAESKYPSTITDNLTTGYSREFQELRVPKTYSTRKGALLLFSEDLAQKYAVADLEASETVTNKHKVYLRTVEDLANSILKYGSQGHVNDNFYLKFARAHCGTFERQFRPGFSAKRYLSTWTRTWDDSVYDNIIKNGYIAEQSMYQFKLSAPNFRRRLVYEDLSRMPEPYKLMRNMLMMPGSLSGYTFYSTPSQEFGEVEFVPAIAALRSTQPQRTYKKLPEKNWRLKAASVIYDAGDDLAQHNVTNDKSDRLHNIRVIKTNGSVQKEVVYSELDRLSQKEVITDLLVKSAVHYALKTQEEVYKDMVDREISGEEYGENDEEVDEEQGFISSIQEFDMKVAVQSLLDSEHGRLTLGANLSGIGDHSQNADRSGAFKPGALYSRFSKHQGSHRSSWSGDGSESEKEYVGDVQNVSRRSSSESMTSFSNVPVLPPIRPALSPIKDVSREASQHITLPSLGQGRALVTEAVTSNLAAGIPSSSSFFKSVTGTTKAHGNWKSMDWKSGGESHPGPKKGSRIMAPDGEIISVGGSVVRNNGHDGDIDSLIDVPGQILQSKDVNTDQPSVSDDNVAEKTIENTSTTMIRNKKLHKKKLGGSQRSNVTEYDIMDMLNNHARQVAENVLAHPSAGTDLETDVKLAAELWPKTHSLKLLPRGGEVKADVIGEVIRSRSANSETSSADEYKSLIKKSLNTAVARAAGLEPDSMYDDAEISSDLLETLANQKMTSDQIELVMDSQGHPRIQAKVQQTEDLEIVQDGHRHFIPGKKEEDVGRQNITIPDMNASLRKGTGGDKVPGLQQKATSSSNAASTEKSVPHSTDQKVAPPGMKSGQAAPANLPGSIAKNKKTDDAKNIKSSSRRGEKAETIKGSKKKGKSSEEPFVVGMPKDKKTNNDQTLPNKGIKKGKKNKKGVAGNENAEKISPRKPAVKTSKGKLQEETEVQTQLSPLQPVPDLGESRMSSPEMKTEESEPEFSFVREQSSPESVEHEEDETKLGPQAKQQMSSSTIDDDYRSDVDFGDDDDTSKLKSISNREARAAKRAAAAAKRREEVEHRRKLKEEQVKREKEEAERQIVLERELEEQRKRLEEERRLRKQQLVVDEEKEQLEADESERKQKLDAERERRAKEEYLRKLEEMKKKQHEEDLRRHELMLQKQKEDDEKRAEEELMMSKMAKDERIEYERMKKEKEEEKGKKELEDKLRRAEEAALAMEEARRLAEALARNRQRLRPDSNLADPYKRKLPI